MSGARRVMGVCWSGGVLLLCALMFGSGVLLLILSLPLRWAWRVVPPGWYLGTYSWGSFSVSLSPWGMTGVVGSHAFGQYGYGLCAAPLLLGAVMGAGLWWRRKRRRRRLEGFAVFEAMAAVDAPL